MMIDFIISSFLLAVVILFTYILQIFYDNYYVNWVPYLL